MPDLGGSIIAVLGLAWVGALLTLVWGLVGDRLRYRRRLLHDWWVSAVRVAITRNPKA